MFIVIYSFEVRQGMENIFEQNWAGLTELIYRYENSLGSRLHRTKQGKYIAYAQWPDKLSWKKAGDNLPLEAKEKRREMRNACFSIETMYKLNVVNDKLYENTLET
jgi:heme-degrading monooxygenase HmoA